MNKLLKRIADVIEVGCKAAEIISSKDGVLTKVKKCIKTITDTDTFKNSSYSFKEEELLKNMGDLKDLQNGKDLAENSCGVYALYKNGKVVYVGSATQKGKGVRKRILEYARGDSHNKNIKKNRNNLKYRYMKVSNKEDAKEIEATLIRELELVKRGWNKCREKKWEK